MAWKNAYDRTLSENYGKQVFLLCDHKFVMRIILIHIQLFKKDSKNMKIIGEMFDRQQKGAPERV